MKRKDGVGDSGIDWSRSSHWLGAGDEEGDLPNQPVRAEDLEPRTRAGRVAGEPRSIWVGSGTTADIVAPVTWLAEGEHAVMNQATLHGPTRWRGIIRICGYLGGHHNRLDVRARSHRGCVCGMSKGRVCGAGVDAGVGWEVSGGLEVERGSTLDGYYVALHSFGL